MMNLRLDAWNAARPGVGLRLGRGLGELLQSFGSGHRVDRSARRDRGRLTETARARGNVDLHEVHSRLRE